MTDAGEGGAGCSVTCLPNLHDPIRPIEGADLWGITISPHVSKLDPVAFYAEASQMYERP